ncbi:MAG: methytransferase partner Trm112 [Methanolinea sp.]|nr:methytransferase partner Trm112 [Methanolinea sp.]
MRRSLLPILCCPVCKGDLSLKVTVENDIEIVEGELSCPTCGVVYPISEGIPDLLPREKEDMVARGEKVRQ